MNFIDTHLTGYRSSRCAGPHSAARPAIGQRLVGVALLVACVLAGACGASFAGPDVGGTVDPCHNHLQCPKGCCMSASFDGEGWDCVAKWEPSSAICKYVGEFDNPGMTGAKPKPDAG